MKLGKYALLSAIGAGSMGMLYRSIDPGTRQLVAVKTLRHDLRAGDDAHEHWERLRNEAQAAGRLEHPGIARVYEYGEQGGRAYLVMEYVQGQSLSQCLEERVSLSIERSVDIVSQLLDALGHAHARGVWHRDVKPANIFLTNGNRVKLTDFGIAHVDSPTPTPWGAVMGTPGYVAPETYLSETFDHRSDLFAVGAVLYQMLTGVAAYTGSAQTILIKVCYETPPAPSKVAGKPALKALDAIVLKALARSAADRFSSAEQFRSAVQQAHAPQRAS
jgi:serine/threonine protein kinase